LIQFKTIRLLSALTLQDENLAVSNLPGRSKRAIRRIKAMATINAKRAVAAGNRWVGMSLASVICLVSACGTDSPPAAPVTYTIGGAISGLAGTSLVRLAYNVRNIEGMSRNHVV
jgi:hypothetical protein